MKVYIFLVPLLTIILSVSLKPVMAKSFSFEQAWQIVLKKSDALAAEQQNIERSVYLQDAASDLYLPSISLNANYTRLDHAVRVKPSEVIDSMPIEDLSQVLDIPTTTLDGLFTSTLTERDIFTSSIRALWPIYTGGRINAAQGIAAAQHDEARFLLTMKQLGKFENLVKYYFAVVLSEQVLKTKKDVERGLNQHYENALKLEQQGQINKLERLQAQVSLDKAQVELKKSFRNAEIAQVALARMLKVNEKAVPTTALFINEKLPNMTLFLDKTLSDFPALKMLNAKKEQAKGLIKIEKGKYYPEVYLYGNYNLSEEDNLASQIAPDWEVGIGVKIPILDSSGRAGKTKAAHSSVRQVEYLQAQAVQDLSVLVEKTYREANQSLEEYQGLKSSLALSNENLLLRSKAFTQGISTSIDVVDAQLYVASIKTQRFVAAYQYMISLTKLLALSTDINTFKHYQSYQGIEVK
ncbi:MAG: outer membrane protein TolC [Colwellia sp.]|jgi:outer membrane protein TolC